MLKWLKMLVGHGVAVLLFYIGGYVGALSVTIMRDVILRTPGVQTDGAVIASLTFSLAMVGVGGGGWLLYHLWKTVGPSNEPRSQSEKPVSGFGLHQIRESYVLDYDLRTWEVTDHTAIPYQGWPSDTWTLESDGEERVLEYDPTDGGTFRLYENVPVMDLTVNGESFVAAVGPNNTDPDPPPKIEYAETEDTSYVLAEEDARVHNKAHVRSDEANRINFLARSRTSDLLLGFMSGIAEYLRGRVGERTRSAWLLRAGYVLGTLGIVGSIGYFGGAPFYAQQAASCGAFLVLFAGYFLLGIVIPKPPPEVLSHYWVYQSDEGELITIQRTDKGWTVHAGREVEPYEFNNILPPEER